MRCTRHKFSVYVKGPGQSASRPKLRPRRQAAQPRRQLKKALNRLQKVRILDSGRLKIRELEPNPVRWTA